MSDVLQHSTFELEQGQPIDFSGYRNICDSVDRFRKIGIQDELSYERVIRDPVTRFSRIGNKRIPVYADIVHEKMYATERCRKLFAVDNVMLQCLPGALPIESIDLPPRTGIVWEEFEIRDGISLGNQPSYVKNETTQISFVHPYISDVEHSAAWMASYSLDFSPSNSTNTEVAKSGSLRQALWLAWAERRDAQGLDALPLDNSNGTFLLFSDDIAERPDIIDGLWRISETGFGEVLGAHHPVSMEFNRAFFDHMVTSDNSVTAAHYVDGKPVCFGFIGLNMNNNDWLNTSSTDLQKRITDARDSGRELVHFYELINDGEKGMGYSMDILDAFLDIAARTKRHFTVFFESTNLSSLYIPDIIRKKINTLSNITLDRDIEMIDRLHYRGAITK